MNKTGYKMLLIAAVAAGLGACKGGIPVDVELPDPIKLDVTIRMKVEKVDDAEEEEEVLMNLQAVRKRVSDRGAEIQTLKDNRIVGENHLGLLHLINPPAGDYGDYVNDTVANENSDRLFLMGHEADEAGETLETVQLREGRQRASASFEEEWIEVPGQFPGEYRWEKKER